MTVPTSQNLPPILPVGTAVVTRIAIRGADGHPAHPRGAAGTIITSSTDPTYPYRVRFPGGDEASLKRHDMQVLSHFHDVQGETGLDRLAEHDMWQHVIYRCVIGSQA